MERCSTIFLNSITLQNVIKSAEKTNAQCISNEAFLITVLQMLFFSRNNTNWFLLITIMWWIHLRKKSIRVDASQPAKNSQFHQERNCSATENETLCLRSSDAVLHWSWESHGYLNMTMLWSFIQGGFTDLFYMIINIIWRKIEFCTYACSTCWL